MSPLALPRLTLVLALGAALGLVSLMSAADTPAPAPAAAVNHPVIPLWPQGTPGSLGDRPQDKPNLTFYPADPANASCAAVIGKAVTTQALFDSMINCINSGGTPPVLGAGTTPNNVVSVNNGHRINAGTTHGQGLDLSASYDWNSGANSWHLGFTGAYTLKWVVSPIPGAPAIDQVNTLNNPLRFRGRADASWSRDVGPGNLTLAGYLNYSNAYTIPQALLPVGVSSQYTHINSYTTVDLALHYDFGDRTDSLLKGFSLTLSAQNVFNAQPPFVINTSSTASIRFDPANASPVGRVLTVQVAKKF